MAINIALKRARKAQRRKQAVVQKQKLALIESSIGCVARKAGATPLRHCLIHGDIGHGMGNVIVARGVTPHRLTAAFFLADLYCLGIKGVVIHEWDAEELAMCLEEMSSQSVLTAVEPAYARRLLRDCAAWASSIGLKPHRDFIAAEQIFGDIDANASDANFVFGRDGKPFYVSGPLESGAEVARTLRHLYERFGPNGFDCVIGSEEF